MAASATKATLAASKASSVAQGASQAASGASAAGTAASSPTVDVLGISLPALDIGAWSLLTATGALLAFLIGLFTLIGRERKSPYIINSAFVIFLVAIAGATVDVMAAATQGQHLGRVLLYVGLLLLIVAMLLSLWRLYKIYVRFVLFVDSPHPKHWPLARSINSIRRALSNKKPYEHNPSTFTPEILASAIEVLTDKNRFKTFRRDDGAISAAVAVRDQRQSDQLLSDLTLLFLKAGYLVQYMATSRHPIQFIEHLKSVVASSNLDWTQFAKRIVAVDAYTSHFGFTDSIYYKEARRLQADLNVKYLTSGPTFAGLHSASSSAFNAIRQKTAADTNVRQPVFIVYEDCAALTDLESAEQYKVFVRHVMPSERMWGGMFTLFVETAPGKSEWALLTAYAGIAVRAIDLES